VEHVEGAGRGLPDTGGGGVDLALARSISILDQPPTQRRLAAGADGGDA
jgi:hypothetical protein